MDKIGEQPRFEIKQTIEQKPLENPVARSFFAKWCEINDSIESQVIDRGDWEQRGIKGILEKRPDGKQTLYIPEDLQLWEMVGVMEVVDRDTFATKPERRDEAKKKVFELGKVFQNAGVYIAQRLTSIREGRVIAQALAEEFYGYGRSLISGERPGKPENINKIASHTLTDQETATIDHFLAGKHLYESRRGRAEKEFYEMERQKTLAQFFRASAKALKLEKKSERGKLQESGILKPWEDNTPFHSLFLTKIEKAIIQKIETPKREFESAIFRRGLEKLVSEMRERGWKFGVNSLFKKVGIDLYIEQKKLTDILNINRLKAELETTRQSGDFAKISTKEREIADKIQEVVATFPYQLSANNPSEMVANQYINCVGASTLGGALMQEVGLNYLLGGVPEHSITVLVTADGKIYWQDMMGTFLNGIEIKDKDLRGVNHKGQPITVKDVVNFSKNLGSSGFRIEIPSFWYRLNMGKLGKFPSPFLILLPPEIGQKSQILNNTGYALSNLGRKEEAVEAYHQAVIFNPMSEYAYDGLGDTLVNLDRNEEAIKAYRQAISINPRFKYPYNGLGDALLNLGRKEEAFEVYSQSIVIDPKDEHPYAGLGNALFSLHRDEEAVKAYRKAISINEKYKVPYNGLGNALFALSRKKEAVEAYRKFIKLADKQKDDYWIKRAEKIIADYKSK